MYQKHTSKYMYSTYCTIKQQNSLNICQPNPPKKRTSNIAIDLSPFMHHDNRYIQLVMKLLSFIYKGNTEGSYWPFITEIYQLVMKPFS